MSAGLGARASWRVRPAADGGMALAVAEAADRCWPCSRRGGGLNTSSSNDVRALSAQKGREMRPRKLVPAVAAVLATMAWVGGAGSAQAAFPDFTGCTATNPVTESCVDVQN